MVALQILGGLVLLLAGGEYLVRGAVAVASRMGVSPMLIGLTLVGFGTSTPELVASLNAAMAGAPGIAVGNVVGSNIANILLILGIAAVISPMVIHREAFRRDGPVMLGAALLMTAVALYGWAGRGVGAVFVVLLVAYMIYGYVSDRRQQDAAAKLHAAEAEEVMPAHPAIWSGLVMAIGGIAAVVFGADLLVDGAIVIARDLGMSESLIGLTLVAIGTSLPELVTSVMAAIRRHGDVAFGNVVGSNIFNVLGILGVTALVEPIAVPAEIAGFDVWVMLATSLLLLAFAASGWRLTRGEGALFVAAYAAYIGWQFW